MSDRDPDQRHSAGDPRRAGARLGVVQELHIERGSSRGLVSNLYLGRVSRVLPGMQAAFIDIGLERTAFLHVADIWESAAGQDRRRACRNRSKTSLCVSPGDDCWCRSSRNRWAPRARGSRHLHEHCPRASWSICRGAHGSACRSASRTRSERERCGRLRTVLLPETEGGYILRTAAQSARRDVLPQTWTYLDKLWAPSCSAGRRDRQRAAAACIEDLAVACGCCAMCVGQSTARVLVDSAAKHTSAWPRSRELIPAAAGAHRAVLRGERPIFDLHGVEEEIEQGAGAQSAAEIGRSSDHRPERSDDHDRRQHRRLTSGTAISRTRSSAPISRRRRSSPGSCGCATSAASSSSISSTWTTRRIAGGAGGARALARRGSGADAHRERFAARSGGDDAQAHPREPRASAVRAMPGLRGARVREDPGNGLQRDLSRDPAAGPQFNRAASC